MPPNSPAGKVLTMEALAQAAGVSKMTVSLALRDHPKISAATRERVRELAEKLGYRPNPLVQTLMANLRSSRPAQYHSTIAWITAHSSRDGWCKHWVHKLYHQGAESRAASLGYKIEPFWALGPRMTGAALSRMLRARGIRGVIVPPVGTPGTRLDLQWEHFACATIGFSFMEPRLHRSAANLHEGMSVALSECARHGYRRAGFAVPADTDARVNHGWLAAYLSWQHFIPAKDRVPPLLAKGPMETLLPDWLRRHRPDVIISPNAEFISWLPALGKRVPADIGLVTLSASGKAASRNISGIDQNDFAIGEAAVDLVVSQLQHNETGIPAHPRFTLIDCAWQDGGTLHCAPATADDKPPASVARPAPTRRAAGMAAD